MVLKVQQLPQFPWFLTGETTPFSLQSWLSGWWWPRKTSCSSLVVAEQSACGSKSLAENSSHVSSANSFTSL